MSNVHIPSSFVQFHPTCNKAHIFCLVRFHLCVLYYRLLVFHWQKFNCKLNATLLTFTYFSPSSILWSLDEIEAIPVFVVCTNLSVDFKVISERFVHIVNFSLLDGLYNIWMLFMGSSPLNSELLSVLPLREERYGFLSSHQVSFVERSCP